MACLTPSPALDQQIRTRLTRQLEAGRVKGPFEIVPVCEEQAGWLVTVTYDVTDPYAYDRHEALGNGRVREVWWMPAKEAPWQLSNWAIGPTLDFDGDGQPEASTWFRFRNELKIWFDGGRTPVYLMLEIDSTGHDQVWAELDGAPVLLYGTYNGLRGLRVRRDRSGEALSPADCARAAGKPCATVPSARQVYDVDPRIDPVAAMLGHRHTLATCAQPDEATKARVARAIEDDELRLADPDGFVQAPELTWGCISHGEVPVIFRADNPSDASTTSWYSVRGEQRTRIRRLPVSWPSEWSDSQRVELVGHADLDGDGFDESIIAEFAGKPVGTHYTVRLGGQLRELPARAVYRGADGKRDGIVRSQPFAERARRDECVPVSPDSCLPGGPPVGWWIGRGPESWDWARDRPEIVVWRGDRFAALPRRAIDAIIDETAAARAPLLPKP
jgi:hypothetical protein